MSGSSTVIDARLRRNVTIILLVASFVSLASQTMMVTALPVIKNSLHVSLNTAQWLTTGYTLLIGVVTPLSSNIYERFSNRKVFLTTVGTFIIGTLIGCFATNFWFLLLARLIQASAGGILMTFQMTTMITIYPPEKRGSVLGMSGLVIASGPALGPSLSGLILEYFSWRWIFIFVLPLMILVWLGAFFKMPNFSEPRPIKIDLLSVLISLVGSALMLGSLTVFEVNVTIASIMLIVGALIIWYFVRRQLRLQNPMLKVQIIRYPSFRLMTAVGCCAFMILLGTEQLLPIFTQNVMHVGSFKSGLIMLPGAICNALFAPIAGRLYDQYGPKWLITFGGILTLIASLPLVTISQSTPLWLITVAYIGRLIGNAFIFNPALSEAFSQLAPNENSHGTALNNTLRQACGAVSVTLLVVISGLPASLTIGVRDAMWVTVGLAVLMLIIFYYYLGWKKRHLNVA